MKVLLIIIVLLIILFITFLFKNKLFNKENYESGDLEININQVNTDSRIIVELRNILKDLDSLFDMFGITYWIDGGTLLGAVRSQDVIPWDDDADISVLLKDEQKLLSLIPRLNQMGYGFSKFWGGYKIYPLNGIDIKFYNRNWKWNETSKDIEDQENFNYKYPFVDVFIVNKFNNIYHYNNKYVQRVWPNYYYKNDELFPLKKYKFNSFYLSGPNNPLPYLNRSYGNEWPFVGYKSYDHLNQRMIPLVKFKVEPNIKST